MNLEIEQRHELAALVEAQLDKMDGHGGFLVDRGPLGVIFALECLGAILQVPPSDKEPK